MHDLLKECCTNATDKDAAVKPLYLPHREGAQWKLCRSTELVLVDHSRYDDVQSLASRLIAGTDYSLFLLPPDSSHGEQVPARNRMTEKDVSLMIPKQIQSKSFAINSNEDILDDLRPGTDDCHGVKRFNFFKSIKNQLHEKS